MDIGVSKWIRVSVISKDMATSLIQLWGLNMGSRKTNTILESDRLC